MDGGPTAKCLQGNQWSLLWWLSARPPVSDCLGFNPDLINVICVTLGQSLHLSVLWNLCVWRLNVRVLTAENSSED